MQPYAQRQGSQLFCTTAHKNAFHDRWKIRGRQLAPLQVASTITRHGRSGDTEIGKAARRSADRLKARWILEDREAGRMPMDQYLRRLMRHHDWPC